MNASKQLKIALAAWTQANANHINKRDHNTDRTLAHAAYALKMAAKKIGQNASDSDIILAAEILKM